jgi:hypothetical protein
MLETITVHGLVVAATEIGFGTRMILLRAKLRDLNDRFIVIQSAMSTRSFGKHRAYLLIAAFFLVLPLFPTLVVVPRLRRRKEQMRRLLKASWPQNNIGTWDPKQCVPWP